MLVNFPGVAFFEERIHDYKEKGKKSYYNKRSTSQWFL